MNEESNNLNDKIYNATKWSAITNILRKLITPVTNMILARILVPEVFGVVATINMVISFADIFTDAGFQKYLIQHDFKDDDELYKSANVSFWTNFGLSTILWLTIFLFRDIIAKIVGSEGYGLHLAMAALSIPLLSFSSIQQAIFKRKFDFKGMFGARLVNSIIPLFVTIPLAYFTKSCWALIIGTLFSNFTDAILLTLKSRWKPKFYYSFEELKRMLSFSIWTLLEQLAIWLTINIDVFILGRLISNYNLGLYKTAMTSVNQITTLITTTIIPVLFSALSRCQSNETDFKNTFYSFQSKCAIILIPMSVGIFVYRELVTWILLGSQWLEATTFIGGIGIMQVFTIIYSNFASEVYRSKGEPKVSFAVQILYILFIIPILLIGTKYSFKTLCILRVFGMLIFVLINLIMLCTRYKFKLRKMFEVILQPLIAAIIMGGIGYILQSNLSSMIAQIFSIIVCIIVYFSCCMVLPKTRKTILETIKLVKNKQKILVSN